MAQPQTLVGTRGTVEPHPRGGWQGVIYEGGDTPQRWKCPHRHRTAETAARCTLRILREAPQYLSRHTFPEVAGWFAEAGLVEVVDLSKGQAHFHAGQGNGINVAGRRPG